MIDIKLKVSPEYRLNVVERIYKSLKFNRRDDKEQYYEILIFKRSLTGIVTFQRDRKMR